MSFNLPAQGAIALIIFTALITAIVAGVGRRFVEAFLDWLLRPIHWLLEELYRWIAPRNPFSIALRSYRKHVQRSWLTKIENPIGPELDVQLEHAFAPLRLISSTSQETIDLFKHVSDHHRCVVLGGPGTGKTTLMKSLVTSVIRGKSNYSLDRLIPVFVVLRKLAAKQQTVRDAIIAAFADFHFPGADKFVDSALRQGKMLIVLDGLDEVGVNREYVAGQIMSFCETDDQLASRNHIIVTCREYSYRTEDLRSVIKNVVRVEPFANHHMRVFLQGWPSYQGRSALALYALIQRDSQIRDICRNPLLLTILTGLYLETQQFELPTSRSRFYKAAIEELIIKRPARREIKQKFEPSDKWQVLQRVSLNRLETVRVDEDPEELTSDHLREHATTVFRKEIDFNEFIKELVEINGIIKPTSDGIYTCAHRTIQEYFAASEAGRIRTSQDVVQRFGERQDLIEVLYFYCSMLRNIPELTKIIESFVNDSRWLEAARCLVSMTEVPDAAYVDRITRELKTLILQDPEFKPVLEILSSLAQRPEAEFDFARKRFSKAVDHLATGTETKGASALESALATSPEAAMRVIPGLLRHETVRWRVAAVELLKDIGTEESLDQLVHLLTSDDKIVRDQAGRALAELAMTRNKDLRNRVGLLPKRVDPDVWPLEEFFPGTLAIPIAESLLDPIETRNTAITYTAKAIRLRVQANSKSDRDFLKGWRNVSRDIWLNTSRLRFGRMAVRFARIFPVLVLFLLAAVELICYRQDKTLLIEINPISVHVIDSQLMRNVQLRARDIITDIEQVRPDGANSNGWSFVEFYTFLTSKKQLTGPATVRQFAGGLVDPYHLLSDADELQQISQVVSKERVDALRDANRAVVTSLPVKQSDRYLIIQHHPFSIMLLVAIIMYFILARATDWAFGVSLTYKTIARTPTMFARVVSYLIGLMPYYLMLNYFLLSPFGVGIKPIRIAFFATIAGSFLIGMLMQKLNWPRNNLMTSVSHVSPQADYAGS